MSFSDGMSEGRNEWSWRPWTWTLGEKIWIFAAIIVLLYIGGAIADALA